MWNHRPGNLTDNYSEPSQCQTDRQPKLGEGEGAKLGEEEKANLGEGEKAKLGEGCPKVRLSQERLAIWGRKDGAKLGEGEGAKLQVSCWSNRLTVGQFAVGQFHLFGLSVSLQSVISHVGQFAVGQNAPHRGTLCQSLVRLRASNNSQIFALEESVLFIKTL
jgi:hypothetical protein